SFYRYILTPLPGMVLTGGILFADALRALERRTSERRALAIACAALLVLLGPSMIRDYKMNRLLGRRDTRTIAREWIERNVPPGVPIGATEAMTPYGKPQLGGRHRYVAFTTVADLERRGVEWVLSDSAPLRFYSPGPTEEQLAELAREAELVLDVEPFKPGTPEPVFDHADAFYAPLQHASSMKRPGPRIRIWRIPRAAPDGAAHGGARSLPETHGRSIPESGRPPP